MRRRCLLYKVQAICRLTLRLPNEIPFVTGVTLVAGKEFAHNCDTGKLSALIQC
jgi:hypothetical protein